MATFGDKKPSRFRSRRLAKRGATVLLLVISGTIFVLSLLLWGISTEAFWRRFIFPHVFGPYWDTTLKWEEFEPNVFPPGATLKNVELVEPGANDRPFLRIKNLQLRLRYKSRPSKLDVERAEIDGVDVNLVVYNRNETNLTRIVQRLFEGKNPSAPPTTVPRDNDIIPYILSSKVNIANASFHLIDKRNAAKQVEYGFVASEPVQLQFTDSTETSSKPGRRDQFTRITAAGDFNALVDDIHLKTTGRFQVDVPNLGKFPNTTAHVALALQPASGESARLNLSADIPLSRIPVRVNATPIQNLDLAMRVSESAEPWLHVSNTNFDPLTGEATTTIAVKGMADQVAASLQGFVAEESRAAVNAHIMRYASLQPRRENQKSVEFDATATLTGKGIAQYAIVDPSEHVPTELTANGTVITRNMPLESLSRFQEMLARLSKDPKAEPTPFISDLRYSWAITADETRQQATLRADMQARPAGAQNDDLLFSMSLVDADNPAEPVTFNPFRTGAWDWRFPSLETVESKVPIYPVFPNYEQLTSEVLAYLNRGTEALDALDLQGASLRHKVHIRDAATLRALLAPIAPNVADAAEGDVELSATRRGGGLPSEWNANIRVDGIHLRGISDVVNAQGSVGFTREGDVLTASDLALKVFRGNGAGEPVEVSLGLPRAGRDGSLGPVTPSYINLATGEAHFELYANAIRREFLEILMQVQTFGLSRQLASPFYQNLLTVLGFRPNDVNANGEADVYVTGDIGEEVRINSLLNVRNVPAANFLLESKPTITGEDDLFDARFSQGFALNRATKLLKPEEFELELFPPQKREAFARLKITTEENTSLDYPMLKSLAAEDIDHIANEGMQPQSLKMLASTVLVRSTRLRQAIRGDGGRMEFTIPDADLRGWRRVLNDGGIPIEGGKLNLHLATELNASDGDHSSVMAMGAFTISDVKLAGAERVIPEVRGTLNVVNEDNILAVKELQATLALDPAYDPTTMRFTGSADVNSFASKWNLAIEEVNHSALDVLRSMSESGIAIATSVMNRLLAGQLGEYAGPKARVNLNFSAESPADGSQLAIHAIQSGEDIDFLPAVLNPLSFRSEEKLVYTAQKQLIIESLGGEITEQDTTSPLLTFVLEKPSSLDDTADTGSTLTIAARKSLTDIADRLARFPLPFFGRTITEGNIAGNMTLHIPANESLRQSVSDFELTLSGLRLSGFGKIIDGALTGRLVSDDDSVVLKDAALDAHVDGISAGRIEINSRYDVATKNLESTVEAIDVNGRLLEALPPDMAIWAQQPTTKLNMHGKFDAGLNDRTAQAVFQMRVRDFGLPSTPLEDGSVITHPPLNMDVELVSGFDRDTSTLLLQDFSALVAKGSYPSAGRLDPLPENASALFRVTQLGTIIFDAGRQVFSSATLAGAGLHAELGPLDLGEYGIVLRRLAGVPLVKGVLAGEATVVASGFGATRIESGRAGLQLSQGIWEKSSGEKIPIEAGFMAAGGHREGAFRLDQAEAMIRYPAAENIPQTDSVAAVGYYTRTGIGKKREFALDLTSPGMQLERVIALISDVQKNNAKSYAPTHPERSGVIDEQPRYELTSLAPKNLTATITGQFDNMAYKEVRFPDTSFKGTYRDGRVSLESLRSLVPEGEISMTGSADLRTGTPSWNYTLNVANVEAKPWVSSLARTEYYDKISGKLSANVHIEGKGLEGRELAETIRGDAKVSLRQGKFDNKRIGRFIGDESDIVADVELVVRNNRALFRLETPWNPSRDLLLQGYLRPLVPGPGGVRYLKAVGEATRMTAVGPRGREMDYRGNQMPFRQPIAGILFETDGPVGGNFSPKLHVRSVNY